MALLALAATAAPALAALPRAPFTFDATPARPSPGQAVTITIVPRGGGGRYDLYLMWATGVRAAFLTREGRWSPRPVPWLVAVEASGAANRWRWAVPGPPGDVPLALVIVGPGGDPLDRTQWQSRPALAWLRAPGEAARVAPDAAIIARLAGAAALAIGLVIAVPRRRHRPRVKKDRAHG